MDRRLRRPGWGASPACCVVCHEPVGNGYSRYASCNARSRSAQHHVCNECLQGLVLMEAEPARLRASRGLIKCPWRGHGAMMDECCAPEWTFQQLAPLLHPGTVSEYVGRLSAMLGTLLDAEETGRCRSPPLGHGAGGGGGAYFRSVDDKLRDYRHYISEQILTLRCPRCSCVWDSYDGCDALSCESCGAGFCALCLEDCGRDAHNHAARMHGTYFGGLARFKQTHAERRRRAVAAFLLALPEPLDVRLRLLDLCELDLEALDIKKSDIASLLVFGDRVPLGLTLHHLLNCLKEAGHGGLVGLWRGVAYMAGLVVPFVVHMVALFCISILSVMSVKAGAWLGSRLWEARASLWGVALVAGIEGLKFSATTAVAFVLFACGVFLLRRRESRSALSITARVGEEQVHGWRTNQRWKLETAAGL